MIVYIAPIVEGQTEQKCIERLFHRIWNEVVLCAARLQILPAIRIQRDQFLSVKSDLLEKQVEAASLKLKSKVKNEPANSGCIMILLDAEKGCPVELSREILQRSLVAQSDVVTRCVVAQQMLENWIVAGSSTLSTYPGFPQHFQLPKSIDRVKGSDWLDQQFRSVNSKRKYKKTGDSEKIINAFSLLECQEKSRSFRKLVKELRDCAPIEGPSPEDSHAESDNEQSS